MLILSPWRAVVSIVTLLAPVASLHAALPLHPAVQATVRSDSTFPPVLLTTEGMASYSPLDLALEQYWRAHPEAKQAHGQQYTYYMVGFIGANTEVFDYPALMQQDTAVAALFKKYHVEPAQFQPLQISVYRAIVNAILKQPVDSTTIEGKNMAFVQAHRAAFAVDWEPLKRQAENLKVMQSLGSQIQGQVEQQLKNGGMLPQDAHVAPMPGGSPSPSKPTP